MSRDALIYLVLFAAVLLLFAPARTFEFTNYDDPQLVRDAHIRRGLTAEGVRWSMTAVTLANWHPITVLSHMADAQFYGPDNAAGAHFTNVLLHAINATLLFAALRGMSGATWKSAAVALLWAVHPLRVESVAWVAERKDLLCAMFFLLTILAYTRYARSGSIAAYAGTLLMFALGLMSKPMIVTLPCVLLLLDCWPLKRPARWRRLVGEKIPLVLLAGGVCVVTMVVQRTAGAMAEDIYPIPLRLGNAAWGYARYLALTFVPTRLAVFYPYYGALPETKLSLSAVIAGVACLFAVTLGAIWFWRRGERSVLIGWLWFVGTLVPVIGLVQVGWQSLADRYTYIPHMGLFIAIVWGVASFLPDQVIVRRIAFAAACLVAGAFSVVTAHQLTHWRNSITLSTHALEVTDHNHVAHALLAQALEDSGDLAGALAHFQEQFRIKPTPPSQSLFNIGRVLSLMNRDAEAQGYYERALAIDPNYADAILNLAHALGRQGRHAEAIERYRRGLQLKPDSARARFYFARELLELGKEAEAREQLLLAREIARGQADRRLLDEIEAQVSHPGTTTRPGGGESTLPALPKPPGTLENPSR